MPSLREEVDKLESLFEASGIFDEDFDYEECDEKEIVCPECDGKGKYLLFNQFHICKICKGKKSVILKL